MVRYTKPEATDDPDYLDWVEATLVGVEEAIKTKQTYMVKIDNWFGKRAKARRGNGAMRHDGGHPAADVVPTGEVGVARSRNALKNSVHPPALL